MATETETVYTLTDADGWTRRACANALHWGEGVTHTATGTDGVVHWYDSPELAAMMDPIHGCYGADAICWRAGVTEVVGHDGTKGGSRSLTTLERVPLPVLTPVQRVEIAIRVSLTVQGLSRPYRAWARRWLDGKDRAVESARVEWAEAAEAAAEWAALAAEWVAEARVAEWVAEAAAKAVRAEARAAGHDSPRAYAATVTRIVREVLDRDREVGDGD